MKLILIFTLAFCAVYADKLNVKNCKAGGTAIVVPSVTTAAGTGVKVTSDTVLTITYDSSTDFVDSDLVTLQLDISKYVWFGYVPIPSFVFKMAVEKSNDPHLTFVKANTVQFGCPVISRYAPCPPPKGQHDFKVVLKPVFERVQKMAGFLGSWLGSGHYRAHADAKLSSNNQQLVCLDIDIEIKM